MRAARVGGRRFGWVLWPVLAWLLSAPAAVRAEEPFEVPPAPQDLPARWVFEVHLDGVARTDAVALCPEGAACVYSGGAGVGASAEHRWPGGLGVYAGYDAWFIDSSSVYELGVHQAARGGARFTLPNATIAHPVADLSVGLSGLGDTFLVESIGVLIQGMLAVEVELSRHFGILGGLGFRAFSHSRFTTSRDGVRRGRGDPFSQAVFLEIGLTVNGRPWATAEADP